ncbi:B12-binding domain-containing radical SAM protein [Cryptosporangium sp. NPDC051539]|uniref:B12-binding domain-containing radical SAM protein n=1 Tax=Cryptosporangium sp. NPDC051539 TaxID=3363962 RepID=UPI0037A58155
MPITASIPSQNVLLVQPPYLRIAGSHNDRLPLELCYHASYLTRAGHSPIVLNADATGAETYIPWRQLFDNFRYVAAAAEGDAAIYDETVERICSFRPDAVVISAADTVTPWVDSGNAYISAELSRRLMRLGIRTVGVGPFYTAVPHRFVDAFTTILPGGPSPSIVDAVAPDARGVIAPSPHDLFLLPSLEMQPADVRDDVVMTAFGCVYSCTFCLARDLTYRPVPPDRVAADIAARRASLIDFGDAILPLRARRVRELAAALRGMAKQYTCEVSVKSITPDRLDALAELGVVQVKLGVESGDDRTLAAMEKKQNRDECLRAAQMIQERGIRLSVYVLLGGPDSDADSVAATYDLCTEIGADDYIVNVWSHHELERRDFRYDGHFSSRMVTEWGLSDDMDRFFALQDARRKFGLGTLLRPPTLATV